MKREVNPDELHRLLRFSHGDEAAARACPEVVVAEPAKNPAQRCQWYGYDGEGPLTPDAAYAAVRAALVEYQPASSIARREHSAALQSTRSRCTHEWKRYGDPSDDDGMTEVCRGCGIERDSALEEVAKTRRAALLAERAKIDEELKALGGEE